VSDGKVISDHFEIATRFCKYSTSKLLFSFALEDNESSPIILNQTNGNELEDICSSFNPGMAPGFDNIPMHLIKNSLDLIKELAPYTID
jgi:hypothetical protein